MTVSLERQHLRYTVRTSREQLGLSQGLTSPRECRKGGLAGGRAWERGLLRRGESCYVFNPWHLPLPPGLDSLLQRVTRPSLSRGKRILPWISEPRAATSFIHPPDRGFLKEFVGQDETLLT